MLLTKAVRLLMATVPPGFVGVPLRVVRSSLGRSDSVCVNIVLLTLAIGELNLSVARIAYALAFPTFV